MKITEYSAIKAFTEDQVLLVDGNGGTKNIRIGDAVQAMLDFMSPMNHRTIFRGKNLGSVITIEQKAAIQAGTFEDLWLGDYWEIDGIKWRIVDFDYWWWTGDPKVEDHHLVIMPDTTLYNAPMNNSNIVTGGYVGSKMYTTNLASAKDTVNAIFGDMVMSHKETLSNAVTDKSVTGVAAYDSTVELPNEPMIYGSYLSSTGCATNSKMQLALFNQVPRFMTANANYWLRDVADNYGFSRVSWDGLSGIDGSSGTWCGVRPVFAIG